MPRWVTHAPKLMRWGYVETSARVRWSECDGQAHAYYGSYISWFDLGREAFGLSVGVDFWKYLITTTEFHVRHHASAYYLDDLVIRTWATTPTARFDCYYEVYRRRGNQLVAEARSSHALVDREKGVMLRAPEDFHEKFEKFLDDQGVVAGRLGTPGRGHTFSPEDHVAPGRSPR